MKITKAGRVLLAGIVACLALSAFADGPTIKVWDPTKAGYTNAMLTQFTVNLTATPVPLYMIVDLTLPLGDAGQITYVYEEDLTNGLWGAWVRNPVTNAGTVVHSVIWTDVATKDLYKTEKLVLRRIPAKSIPELDKDRWCHATRSRSRSRSRSRGRFLRVFRYRFR
ncbi:MAG: hypothetical protein WC340_16165 [Kiritimatiellia bacterium]